MRKFIEHAIASVLVGAVITVCCVWPWFVFTAVLVLFGGFIIIGAFSPAYMWLVEWVGDVIDLVKDKFRREQRS